jgi:hypothetical protein
MPFFSSWCWRRDRAERFPLFRTVRKGFRFSAACGKLSAFPQCAENFPQAGGIRSGVESFRFVFGDNTLLARGT